MQIHLFVSHVTSVAIFCYQVCDNGKSADYPCYTGVFRLFGVVYYGQSRDVSGAFYQNRLLSLAHGIPLTAYFLHTGALWNDSFYRRILQKKQKTLWRKTIVEIMSD
jgi:hypothetical protein